MNPDTPVLYVPDTTAELIPFLRDLYPAEEVVHAVARGDQATAQKVATIRGFLDEIEDLIAHAAEESARANG